MKKYIILFFAAIGINFYTHSQTATLDLYWSSARTDNFTAGTPEGKAAAQSAGYTHSRAEGLVYTTQQPNTVPLRLFYRGANTDNYITTVTANLPFGYTLVRTIGYIYKNPTEGTKPLITFYNAERQDYFTTATQEGFVGAASAGYSFVRIEGYLPQ